MKSVGILLLIIALMGFSFYWFSWRPEKIRHNCSWIERTEQEKVLRSDLTAEQKQILENYPTPTGKLFDDYNAEEAFRKQYNTDSFYTTVSKLYWDQATDEEYKICIREKGLR